MAKKVDKKPGFVPENAPAGLFINAQYLKDLSFENPNPLDAYKTNEKPDIKIKSAHEFKYYINFNKLNLDNIGIIVF